jgi:hypothetical protein
MKIANKLCGKKSGTSRKASVMTFKGNKPHVIKNPSIMKDRESDSRGNVIASSNIDDRIKKHGEILSKNKMIFFA